uniref:Ig-like domain-containing protein n=1 Tax=Ursus americanus TaxID=9643 RepID=A0A452RWI4_URSAM
MGSRLLCCVALCLLGAGPVESEVTQTPRHLIKTRGQKATLRCSPVSGHLSVYWYQQVLGQGPQFLIQYYDMKERDKGKIPERFSAQQFSDYSSQLDMTLLEPEDSALYLCASSLAQPCSISSLLYKNLPPPPPPAQEAMARVARPAAVARALGKQTGLSQTLILLLTCVACLSARRNHAR